MASIYDIAKIASGDPLGAAADAAKEADIIFQQYQNQKERVEEINKAIAEAKRKQKKNKFGYNLLGSALGGLGGLLFPTAGPVIQGLLAGLGSGVAEKYRQDRTDSTKKLRELRSKYKNRAISDDITEAIDAFEMEKDAMLQTDTIANALTAAMLPVKETESFKQIPVSDVPETVIEGRTTYPFNPITGVSEEIAREIPFQDTGFEEVLVKNLGIKPDKEMITAITGIDEETLNKFDFLDEDIVAGLIRALGPQAYSAFTTPKITVDPLYQPQFRNPFGGF
tara:strand:- start:14289 stop:15131 length:843 start_codon:yes stop_codon:yes gene_type:complete